MDAAERREWEAAARAAAAAMRRTGALVKGTLEDRGLVHELDGAFGLTEDAVAASLLGTRPGGEAARFAAARNWLRRVVLSAGAVEGVGEAAAAALETCEGRLGNERVAGLCSPGKGAPFPQADRLSRLTRLVEHLNAKPRANDPDSVMAALNDDGSAKDLEAARQLSYYTEAAVFLGLLQKLSAASWRLTPFGKAWHDAEPQDRKVLFAAAMAKASPVFGEAVALHKAGRLDGDAAERVLAALLPNDGKINETTKSRRARTVMAWASAVADAWPSIPPKAAEKDKAADER